VSCQVKKFSSNKFLFFLRLQIFFVASSHAADLYCSSPGASCSSIDRITNVAAANEAINVIGQSAGYIDPVTSNVYFSSKSQFDYFPTKIFSIFPQLQLVQLDRNNLPNLVTNAFDNCGQFTTLMTNYLNFTNLPAGFAQNCKKLNSISLQFGKLSTLDPNALQGLTGLTQIGLMYNEITCIPPTFFSPASSLEMIFLAYNKITAIDPAAFKGLPKLFNIDLLGNNIANLPDFNIDGTSTSLTSNTFNINLSGNPVNAINPNFLSTLYALRPTLSTSIIFTTSVCFGGNLSINQGNWLATNASMTICYNNWTPAIASAPVPCAAVTTTSTSTTPVVKGSSVCCDQGVLQVILSAIRNTSLDIKFV
jgi:hypothetical protein